MAWNKFDLNYQQLNENNQSDKNKNMNNEFDYGEDIKVYWLEKEKIIEY